MIFGVNGLMRGFGLLIDVFRCCLEEDLVYLAFEMGVGSILEGVCK